MKNSMGMDSSVLVREARNAMRADLALMASSAGTIPSTFFWFGQIKHPYIEQHDSAEPGAETDNTNAVRQRKRIDNTLHAAANLS